MVQMKKPSGPNPNFRKSYNNNPVKNRKNERIRAQEVRVISHDGKQIGVLNTQEALKLARSQGLDLVEISAAARPPVCRIIDFGKFMYEQTKKSKDGKSPATKLKEVKFRVNIEQHDYETKLRHCEQFLSKSYKVKLILTLKGREMGKNALGVDLVVRAVNDLSGMGVADSEPRLVGRNVTTIISPLAASKRKPRFLRQDEHEEDLED